MLPNVLSKKADTETVVTALERTKGMMYVSAKSGLYDRSFI